MKAYFMWLVILIVGIFGSFLLTGCITPDKWSPEQHRDTMRFCSLACGEDRMQSYDAWSAKCGCRETK